MKYLSVRQLAEKAGVDDNRVYYLAGIFKRLPTVKECQEYKAKRGRPRKRFEDVPKKTKE